MFSSSALRAQDPTFSQFYLNPLYVNPAYAGMNEGLRVCANYRNLWGRIPSRFPTYSLSVDAQNLSISSGLGFNIISDTEGEGSLRTQSFGVFYSYRAILIPKHMIFHGGIQTSIVSRRVDWSSLIFSDQIDPVLGVVKPTATPEPNQQNVFYPDFSAGGVLRFNHNTRRKKLLATWTLGAAIHHLVQPNESIIRQRSVLPRRFVGQAGVLIPIRHEVTRNKIAINPQVLYEQQGPMRTFMASVTTLVQPVYAGIGVRNQTPLIPDIRRQDALFISFGLNSNWNKEIFYKMGYSYDLTVSQLKASTAGTHELALVIEFKKFSFNKRLNPKKKTECPDF
ncbi:hypothetical protein LBMAG25_04990 [Bacteroidota bacterium]|nr:hypothetical protein LBMAG25_04990 [Bacteroidota bacterium]